MAIKSIKIVQSVTNKTEITERYFSEISKEGVITQQEEIELAKRIRNGDKSALDKLVKSNLKFVISVAKQFQNKGISFDDLISEGNLGLIEAANRFDETRGFKFISYAVWWIRQAILKSISEHGRVVRLPLNRIGDISRYTSATIKLEQKLKRSPNSDEIMEELQISEEEYRILITSSSWSVSLDKKISEGEDDTTLMDVIENKNSMRPDENVVDESFHTDLARVLNNLEDPREREVIKLYYGIGNNSSMALEEIGLKLGVGKERVRQIKDKALLHLRIRDRSNLLKKYLN